MKLYELMIIIGLVLSSQIMINYSMAYGFGICISVCIANEFIEHKLKI